MKRIIFVAMLSLVAAMPIFASSGPVVQHSTWNLLLVPFGAVALGLTITPANIAGLYQSFNTIFNKALAAAQPQYNKIAMTVPSSTRQNAYVWLGAWPKMREFINDREFHKLEAFDYYIKNKKFETSIALPEEDIEDDVQGVYQPMVEAMAIVTKKHPDILTFDLLNNAFTAKGYDGETFISSDHESGSNASDEVLSFAPGGSYGKAKAALDRIVDTQGEPLFSGDEQDVLVVAPELEEKARTGLHADYISVGGGSTQDNPWKNSADLVKSPRIKSKTAWFIIRPFAGLMPLIYQTRRPVRFVTKNDPNVSDFTFMTGKYAFGADCRDNAGYGLHQLIFGSTGTVSPS